MINTKIIEACKKSTKYVNKNATQLYVNTDYNNVKCNVYIERFK